MTISDGQAEATISQGTTTGGITFHDVMSKQTDTKQTTDTSSLPSLISAGASLALGLPDLHLYEAGKALATAAVGPDWVLPVGANSKDKKKDVPLEQIDKPHPDLPDVWNHPPSTTMDGKCGITGVCNLLRLYGIDKEPKDIDLSRYRSWGPGLQAGKFAEDMTELSGKTFTAKTIEDGSKALDVLKNNIKDGKPVAIMYMTGTTNAHWVVVTGVNEGKDGPELTVQSWGAYHKVQWKDIQSQWARAWNGPYPYIVGDEASTIMKKVNK